MECPICGRQADCDYETGYDGDDICPYHTQEEIEEFMEFEEDNLGVTRDDEFDGIGGLQGARE